MILAGDVGGTKILLEAGEFNSGRWRPALSRRYLVHEFASMDAVMGAFLEAWREARPPRARLTAAAIGVAGPRLANCVTMTNRPWRLDGDHLAARFGLPRLRLLNDLEAAAYGLDLLPSRDFLTYQPGKALPNGNQVLLGVGTGLGVAYRVNSGSDPLIRSAPAKSGLRGLTPNLPAVIAGEGGHVGFSPATARQVELWKTLSRTHARVEAEHVACGGALERDGMELFSANLGNIAGDQALNVMATGGVFLCGGVIARIGRSIDADAFRAAFCAKGAHGPILMKIPVRAVTHERLALIGAARFACSWKFDSL